MTTISSPKKDRKFFIDWLRILLILSVFVYHIGMFFNTWGWHVKNNVEVEWFNDIMWFLHLWRMPLLFLVSGVGTYYALGFRTSKQYLSERTRRIFIPFIIGIFTLVPIQVYLEKSSEYTSLMHYYPHMFDGIYPTGNFSWHHLWFLIYLFLIALLISPFLNYLRSKKFNEIRQRWVCRLSRPLGLNWVMLILIISQAILRQYFPDSTHAVYNDWAYFVYYLLFFLAGFIFITEDKMVDALTAQRRLYLVQTVLATIVLFSVDLIFTDETVLDWLYGVTGIVIAWSCGITALGYSKQYLNFDSKWRKLCNEGIYPFYLLHQPVIIIMGFYLAPFQISVTFKILLLSVASFVASVVIYWMLIRPFNFLRIMFGLKPLTRTTQPKMNDGTVKYTLKEVNK